MKYIYILYTQAHTSDYIYKIKHRKIKNHDRSFCIFAMMTLRCVFFSVEERSVHLG